MKISDKGGTKHEPAPQGTHLARCFAVIDLGTQATEYKGEVKKARKILLGFELPEELHVFNPDKGPEPFSVWNRFTASLHEKSVLRPLLESWRGQAFTQEELAGFELKNVLGAAAMISIIHGNGYANISGIAKEPKSSKCPPPINAPIYFSLDDGEFDNASFDALSDKLKETISKTPEFAKATGKKVPAEGEASPFDEAEADSSSGLPF